MKLHIKLYCGLIALLPIILLSPCVAQSLKAFPGARINAASWMDIDGKFWLFGGSGYSNVTSPTNLSGIGYFNDLWCYDPLLNEWFWVGGTHLVNRRSVYGTLGVSTNLTTPGGRSGAASWIDTEGTLYLFGGLGYSETESGRLADLWIFQRPSNQWTWIGGTSAIAQPPVFGEQGVPSPYNTPGNQVQSFVWSQDDGNGAWLFANGHLWLYNISSNEWSWFGQLTNQSEFYGTKGVPDPANRPSTRSRPTLWVGVDNSLWLFGGGSAKGIMSDTWKYNLQTGEWTWLHGNSTPYLPGFYGELGKPSNFTTPGFRADSASWTDSSGLLWLFGGGGYGNSTVSGLLNDLWCYNPLTNQWTWMGGSTVVNSPGNYGEQRSPSKSYMPRSRQGAATWSSPDGALWLFGGQTLDESFNYMNDLWRFNTSSGEWTWMSGSKEPGEYGLYIIPPSVLSPSSMTDSPEPIPSIDPPTTGQSKDITQIVVPAVVVPLVAVGVTIGVLIGLKRRKAKKKQHMDNPLTVLSSSDRRMIPYTSVTCEKEIGAGSYGKVYLGKWQATKVAVKVSNNSISTPEFFKEAEFQLNIPPHPNIVQLLGVSIDGPHPLVILEYCNNGSLDSLLFDTNQQISELTQIHIATSIAKGLYHLHTNNIVHRDLAARNILMHNGEPKISDFGMSRVIKEAAQMAKTASNIGPIRWMAPESVKSQTYSFKSDVWMYGIILYEITARQEPHIGEDILDVGIKIRDSGATPTIPSSCPPILREIMQVCWLRDPNLRPTMEQLCQKLDGYTE